MNFKNHIFFSVVIFSALILVIQYCSIPLWNPPAGYDAHSYLLMASNLAMSQELIPPHLFQRLFPPVLVWVVVKFLNIFLSPMNLKTGFFLLSHLSFFLFSLTLFLFIQKKINDFILSLSLTLLLLFSSWPMTYSLHNFYQLCDIFCCLFTLLILVALQEKKYISFWWLGLFSIFTRQNLIILVVLGNIHFIVNSPLPLHQQKKFFTGLILHLVSIVLLFYFSSVKTTLQHLSLIPTMNEWTPLISLYHMLSPFLLIFLFQFKTIWRLMKRNFPLAIFCLFTIYQPISLWKITQIVNFERIVWQGVWPIYLLGVIILGKIVTQSANKYLKYLLACSTFLLGTFRLQDQLDMHRFPLILTPPYYRDYLIIIFTGIFLLAWWTSYNG